MSEKIRPNNIEKRFIVIDPTTQPKEEKKDFILIDQPIDLIDVQEKRLTFVNDMLSQNINLDEIKIVVNNLDKDVRCISRNDRQLTNKYLRENVLVPNMDSSKAQRYHQLLNRIENTKPEYSGLSYGIFMPTYLEELSLYKDKNNQSEDHKSLLIGALTLDTVQEYMGAVKSVFDNAQTLSIDIMGGGKINKVEQFQIMNGLDTTFENNHFDTIHTNFLLHMLCDKKGNNDEQVLGDDDSKIKELFSETHRILKTDGKLIMVEGNLEYAFQTHDSYKIKAKIYNILRENGYKNIQIKPSKLFTDINDLTRFTRSSAGNSDAVKNTQTSESTVTITASKI